MSSVMYREYQHSDAGSWLRLHDAVFPPISREYWDRWSAGEDVTAVVAVRDEAVVGTIPFQFREFVIRPGVTVRAAFEYSVAVREELRGQGVGSAMMDCAKDILKDRCDAMMVFRGEEARPAYNFYVRNGHYDLVFARLWSLEDTADRPPGRVDLLPIEDLYQQEGEVLEVFESAFEGAGGHARRRLGFWRPMIENCNWEEVRHDMRFFCWEREGTMVGYAVAGKQAGQPVVTLLELATRDGDAVRGKILLNAVAAFAGALRSRLTAYCPDNGLYADAFRGVGFAPARRAKSSMMIMAHPLNAEAIARKAWAGNDALKDAEVVAWSPRREVVLHKADAPRRRIEIELKEDLLTRLLFCRLDLVRAWENELVSVQVNSVGQTFLSAPLGQAGMPVPPTGGRAEVEAVASALPFTRWEYQHMEMI